MQEKEEKEERGKQTLRKRREENRRFTSPSRDQMAVNFMQKSSISAHVLDHHHAYYSKWHLSHTIRSTHSWRIGAKRAEMQYAYPHT